MTSDALPPIDLVRHARARRMRLRYDPVRDRLRLTLPHRASQRVALAWAAGQSDWVAAQRAARAPTRALEPGALVPYRGDDLRLVHDPTGPRRVERSGDRLIAGGPADTLPRRVEQWLRAEARRLLSEDVAHFAALAGVTVRSVAIGDARTRWGSCSPDGRLRFSWRLVCAPDAVRRYVAAHEVAHRLYLDHSSAFRAAEAQLVEGDAAALSRQLSAMGPTLQRIGR